MNTQTNTLFNMVITTACSLQKGKGKFGLWPQVVTMATSTETETKSGGILSWKKTQMIDVTKYYDKQNGEKYGNKNIYKNHEKSLYVYWLTAK